MSKSASKKTRPYCDEAYQRMRHILMSYRNLKNATSGNVYAWQDLTDDICVYYDKDANFPKNSLENFARGLDTKDGHKFSTPEDDRVEAIIEFLTNKESNGYFCDRDVLLAPIPFKTPYFLQEYVNGIDFDDHFYELDDIKKEYRCYYTHVDGDFTITLNILTPISNLALLVDVIKKATPSAKDLKLSAALMDVTPEVYKGFVVRHQGNFYVYVKHPRSDSVLFYLSLGIGKDNNSIPLPDQLVLLEHGLPEEILSEGDNLLQLVTENFEETIQHFHLKHMTETGE